jgi:hypothetical protein
MDIQRGGRKRVSFWGCVEEFLFGVSVQVVLLVEVGNVALEEMVAWCL